MKKMQLAALFLSCCLGFGCLAGCSKDPDNGGTKKDAYDVLNLGEIAVGMYVTPSDGYRNQQSFDWMSESGINFVNGFRWYEDTDAEIMQCLNYSEKAGLKYLVNDKLILDNLTKYFSTKNPLLIDQAIAQVQKYNSHPAYAGQFFIDEPNRAQLNDIAELTNAFDQSYPGTFWNINHFPHNVVDLGCTYEQFIDDYFSLTNAKLFSYDCYPLLVFDESDPTAHGEMDGFFYGLDLVRSKTKERGVPFWTFIQTLGIGGADGVLQKRDPSENDIRWSVFVNLAFGAKGLQYFTYFTPSNGAETFTPSMIDTNGNKTRHYEEVKRVNAEFEEYGKLLLHCDAEGIIYNKQNSNRRYRLYADKLESYGAVTEVGGDSFVAGCFRHTQTGKQYLMIVPPTPRSAAHVELTVSGKSALAAFVDGVAQSIAVTNGVASFDIAAGNAVFVEV